MTDDATSAETALFSFFPAPIEPIYDEKGTKIRPASMTPTRSLTALDLYRLVRGDEYKDLIEAVRAAPPGDGPDQRKGLKRRTLPFVIPGGVFPKRAAKYLTYASGYLMGDLDHFPDEQTLLTYRARLINDPYPVLIFRSPSGDGLKILVRIPPSDPATFARRVKAFYRYLKKAYAIDALHLDEDTYNIVWPCFVSHDRDAHLNLYAKTFEDMDDAADVPAPTPLPATPGLPGLRIPAGKRHAALRAESVRLHAAGKTYDEALALLRAYNQRECSPPKPDDEVRALVRSAFEKNISRQGASGGSGLSEEADALRAQVVEDLLTPPFVRLDTGDVEGVAKLKERLVLLGLASGDWTLSAGLKDRVVEETGCKRAYVTQLFKDAYRIFSAQRKANEKKSARSQAPYPPKTHATHATDATLTPKYDPAGCLGPDFAFEPLGFRTWLVVTYDATDATVKAREIVTATKSDDDDEFTLRLQDGRVLRLSDTAAHFLGALPYETPSPEQVARYVRGDYLVPAIQDLYARLINFVRLFFDVARRGDVVVIAVYVLQSWVSPILEQGQFPALFLCFDGPYASAKSSHSEAVSQVSRHGYFFGGTTVASFKWLVHLYRLTALIDELDELPYEDQKQLESMLRKANVPGQPFSQWDKETHTKQTFFLYGGHGYNLRGHEEDALGSRAYHVRTMKSEDSTVPVNMLTKTLMLRALRDDLFFWSLETRGAARRRLDESVAFVASVAAFLPPFTEKERTLFSDALIKRFREQLYAKLVQAFPNEQKRFLHGLTLRNAQLTYMLLVLSKLLDVDAFADLKDAIMARVADERLPQSLLQEQVVETLSEILTKSDPEEPLKWLQPPAKYAGSPIFPHSFFMKRLGAALDRMRAKRPAPEEIERCLKELGFQKGEGRTIDRQRYLDRTMLTLVFSEGILARLRLVADSDAGMVQEEVPSSSKSKAGRKKARSLSKRKVVLHVVTELNKRNGKRGCSFAEIQKAAPSLSEALLTETLAHLMSEKQLYESPRDCYKVLL